MARGLRLQCCICKAVCLSAEPGRKRSVWVPCNRTLVASHGICPNCLPRELAKARRAAKRESDVALTP